MNRPGIEAIASIGSTVARTPQVAPQTAAPKASFTQMMLEGIDKVSEKAKTADALVSAFVLDDSVPPHRVIYALEQSSSSLQMLMQVRNRLVEGYQEIMRTQL